MTVPQTPASPTLSLIVLGWNNLELTSRCVRSLRSHTDTDYELIIVDNGSTDGSAAYARSEADIAVVNDSNLGFASGMNSGLAVARGHYTAFINNDTEFPAGWASRIVETFESHGNAGIVLPAVTAAGNPISVRENPGTERLVLTPFAEFPSGVVYVLPTHLIRALGGWNEEYRTASAEDLDLAFTVWAHDRDIVLDERVLVDHEGQATVRNLPDRKTLYRRNLAQFLDRWEAIPLTEPLVEMPDPDRLRQNQERAQTAVMWIRRMLEAREQEADLQSRPPEATVPKTARLRKWWRK